MPHHVTQRGNRRMQTFFGDDDYRAYLSLLVEWCRRFEVRIWAYCLMPNHVHLILVPSSADGLAEAVAQVHQRYTRRINFRQKWRGYLWQGRFGSFVMDEAHLLAAGAYVERNPVKAALAAEAPAWPWSSAAAHVAGGGDAVAEGEWLMDRIGGWTCTWGQYLAQSDGDQMGRLLRSHESTGRPLGDERFVKHIGATLGRDLIAKKPGRKRKAAAK
jgi:putative transposase